MEVASFAEIAEEFHRLRPGAVLEGKRDPAFGLLRLDPTRIELTGLRHRAAGPPLVWRPARP
jgi:hypothetical protein